MLVLTRRTQESLMIGDDITITVLAINERSVRLGVKAPRRIPVHREEVYEKLRAQHKGAVEGEQVVPALALEVAGA